MAASEVTLDDKYVLEEGRVFITGVQALIRVMLDRGRLDKRDGLNTAGFVSGYRGSPLGGLDQQAHRAEKFLKAQNIVFKEGLNEDLAATAVWGSQQPNLFPGARYDGVFGMWYGKAPGVDRTGDAFKHANFAGTWPKGGVVAVAGDDHSAKSSTLPSQSEYAFQDFEIPVLAPADVQDVLDLGLLAYGMSRFSGLWVGLIALADMMDSGVTIDASLSRHHHVIPEGFRMPPGGLGIRTKDQPLDKERRLRLFKIPAAIAYAKANGVDRTTLSSPRRRLGIAAHGQAYRDVLEAFRAMGLSLEEASDLGVTLYKVGMPWPLEPTGIRAFARGLETLMVVEHKRPMLEGQVRAALYDLPSHAHPKVVGKVDEQGHPLLSELGALSVAEVALAIADRLPPGPHMDRVYDFLSRVSTSSVAAVSLGAEQIRKPFFCSGCPHNTSTRLPDGSRALAGIGCHYMASFNDPHTDLTSHMGGEGLTWAGAAPFTDEQHVFVNLGDGTYNHSGSLAIRASIAMGSHITYKLLYNDAVAMTGGQAPESGFTVPQITRQLASEGVAKIIVVADEPDRYENVADLAAGVPVYPRDQLDNVQKMLRETAGVTVLIYDQMCATERRRRRRRGRMPESKTRVFINPLVCEGCGDCSRVSNCVSIEPVNTAFGRKRKIDQSSCNQDYSCVNGFCPSFVTIEGGENAHAPTRLDLSGPKAPAPEIQPLSGVRNIIFTGIGGTGVTTVASILAMAAHVDGRSGSVVDMTGLAQKGGAVFSHVRIGETPTTPVGSRVPAASTDVLIACDLLVAAGPEALALYSKDRTAAVGNGDFQPTADFVSNRDVRFDAGAMARRLAGACQSYDACPAVNLAETRLGDAIYANMIMLGFAWQKGLVPVRLEALHKAIELNGVEKEENLQAFEIGRLAAHDPTSRGPGENDAPTPETMGLDELIAHRTKELIGYQNAAYSKRFADRIAKVRAADVAAGGDESLTRMAAISLYQLMAYKDEYEVARLYTDGRFAKALGETFKGGSLKVWLSPPAIHTNGADGRPAKSAFGEWMLKLAFPNLAKLKGLRGTAMDPFGHTEHRKLERKLMTDFEADLDRIAAELTPERLPLAREIAALPQDIRGYGYIKEEAAAAAAVERGQLWAQWTGGVSPPTTTHSLDLSRVRTNA